MAMTQATKALPKVMRYALSLAVVSFLFASCSKEPVTMPNHSSAKAITDGKLQQQLLDKSYEIPAVGIYNRTMDKILVFKRTGPGSRSFSFTTQPASGINFASSNGGQWVYTEQGGMVVITEPSAGLGAGGGLVAAGNTTLDIDFAVCFAAGEEAMGGGMFGPEMGDVAGVIGIAGDFEALANGDFDESEDDIFDYFHGFAYYFVYADQLSNTSYEVLDWVENEGQPEEELQDFSLAFVVSLQNEGGIYISKDGNISVNGGTMQFNGTYYAIEGIGFFDGEDEDATFTEVSGYGGMGCQ